MGRCVVGGLPGPDHLAGIEFTLDQFKASGWWALGTTLRLR